MSACGMRLHAQCNDVLYAPYMHILMPPAGWWFGYLAGATVFLAVYTCVGTSSSFDCTATTTCVYVGGSVGALDRHL